MGMIKHSQNTQSNKCAISLQYLKKDVRDGSHFFHADKQSFHKWKLSFLMKVARHNHSTQRTAVAMQNIQIFYGAPVMFVVTYFS